MMRRRYSLLGPVVAAIAIAGLAPCARADFEVVVQEVDSTGKVVAESSSTAATNGGSTINFSTSLGSYNVAVVTAIQNSATGAPGPAQLETSTTVGLIGTSQTSDSLRVIVSATGFTFPSPNPVILTSHIGGNDSTGTITFQSFADNSNNLFGVTNAYANSVNPGIAALPGTQVAGSAGAVTTGLQTASGGAFPGDASLIYNASLPYSLTNVTTYGGLTANQIDSGNGSTEVTAPAPSSMVLCSAALAAFGINAARRRKLLTFCGV